MLSIKTAIHTTLISALLTGCASNNTETKGDLQKHLHISKAYQATYSAPNNFAYQTEHFYSDGNGRLREDISGQGPTVVHVLDQNTNETTMWAEGTNEFVRRPSQPMDPLVMRVNLEKLDSSNAEPLGARVISGHKCHGWKEAGTEVWLDDDFGCPVTATAGGITSTLTEFSDRAPDPSMFAPPPGYTGKTIAANRQSGNSRVMSEFARHMRR